MKKIYILALLIFASSFYSNAQIISDDFESYALGPLFPTAHWTNWSQDPSPANNAENLIISNSFAVSGTQSGNIGNNTIQDAILLLGNLSSGLYTLEFKMYVPTGSEGYFNIQGTIPAGALAGVFNSGNIHFNRDQTMPGVGLDDATAYTWTFPHDTWFDVEINFDLDAGVPTYQMFINGTAAHTAPAEFQAEIVLGGLDFFSVNAGHNAYYDDLLFDVTSLSVDEFAKDIFSVYPNPVKDILNFNSVARIDAVSIFNILGKKVLEVQPGKVSPKVDMRHLPSGVYLMTVTIGDTSKTIKIIK